MLFSAILSLAALASAASAVSVTYYLGYDDRSRKLTAVACSDGENGLLNHKGWQTQGDIPVFPYIGGAEAVASWNSPNCGSCWRLEYKGQSVTVMAVDHALSGFNIGGQAMDRLTNGQGRALRRIDATATRLDAKECGF